MSRKRRKTRLAVGVAQGMAPVGSGSVGMAMAWYRPNQWDRLREVSEDVDNLEETHDKWMRSALKTIADLEAEGVRCVKVDVDVDKLVAWCASQGLPVSSESRAHYASVQGRELHER